MRNMIETESKAWKYLRKKLIKQGGLTPTWLFKKGSGLCAEVTTLNGRGMLSWDVTQAMHARIMDHLAALNEGKAEMGKTAYLAPIGKVEPRIIAVQWFILEAIEEERAVAKAAAAEAAEYAKLADRVLEIDLSEDEDDGYVARSNSLVEGATFEEMEAGAGGRGFDANDSDSSPW